MFVDKGLRGDVGGAVEGGFGILKIAVVVGVIGRLMSLAGKFVCLAIPSDIRGSGLLYAGVACDAFAAVVDLIGMFSPLPPAVALAPMLLSLLGILFFIMFLRTLGDYLRDRGVTSTGTTAFTLCVATVVFYGLAFLGLLAQSAGLAGIMVILGGLIGLVFIVFYLILLQKAKGGAARLGPPRPRGLRRLRRRTPPPAPRCGRRRRGRPTPPPPRPGRRLTVRPRAQRSPGAAGRPRREHVTRSSAETPAI